MARMDIQTRSLWKRLLPAAGFLALSLGLLLLCLAQPFPALADGGGFVTPTFTPSPTPTPTITPSVTPIPTETPIPSPTLAIGVVDVDATRAAATLQALAAMDQDEGVGGIGSLNLGGVLCWPFALGFILLVILVSATVLRPQPAP